MRRSGLAGAAVSGLLLMGAADSTLAPGLWEVMNRPGVATLDGRPLKDLPLPVLEPERLCLSAAAAADPASFLPGDTRADCRIEKASVAGGRISLRAACPSPDGGKEGSMVLSGRYDSASYDIDFETTAFGDNGRMTFSGKLAGRRLGNCVAGS